jgi:hypothetical protein
MVACAAALCRIAATHVELLGRRGATHDVWMSVCVFFVLMCVFMFLFLCLLCLLCFFRVGGCMRLPPYGSKGNAGRGGLLDKGKASRSGKRRPGLERWVHGPTHGTHARTSQRAKGRGAGGTGK